MSIESFKSPSHHGNHARFSIIADAPPVAGHAATAHLQEWYTVPHQERPAAPTLRDINNREEAKLAKLETGYQGKASQILRLSSRVFSPLGPPADINGA